MKTHPRAESFVACAVPGPPLPAHVCERAPAPRPVPAARAIPRSDPCYPPGLNDLDDAPAVLYLRGAWPLDVPTVAIVGSRAATSYGLSFARQLAADLAGLGVVVVSGLARGIDAAAHHGALEHGGTTVAVLPGGLDQVTPVHHRELAETIAHRGAIVSEWPSGVPVQSGLFVRRNRLIAALSGATVVVEAAERSGALGTAAAARRLGRVVLAVPGDVDRPTSRGCNALVRAGAVPCENAADVMRVLAPSTTLGSETRPVARLLAMLDARPLSAETLAQGAGLEIDAALAGLLTLEWSGLAIAHPGQRWSRPARP